MVTVDTQRVEYATPGHCFDADGEWWHLPGTCTAYGVDRPNGDRCCRYLPEPSAADAAGNTPASPDGAPYPSGGTEASGPLTLGAEPITLALLEQLLARELTLPDGRVLRYRLGDELEVRIGDWLPAGTALIVNRTAMERELRRSPFPMSRYAEGVTQDLPWPPMGPRDRLVLDT